MASGRGCGRWGGIPWQLLCMPHGGPIVFINQHIGAYRMRVLKYGGQSFDRGHGRSGPPVVRMVNTNFDQEAFDTIDLL